MISFLLKIFGKTYTPDPKLPTNLIIRIIFQRFIWLVRGLLRIQKLVFLGNSVSLIGINSSDIGRYCTFERHCVIDGYGKRPLKVGDRTKIGAYSIISTTSHLSKLGIGLSIGCDCGVSEYCYFGSSGGITIGNDVIMGQYVSFHSENHGFSDANIPIRLQPVTSEGIVLGNNIWIGAKVTILDGSVIGDNCVIAAGSVVRGNFPSNCVIGGIPARLLKSIS